MKLLITSEQRVGSRWMHYLFADMLSQDTSPEIDGSRFYKGELDTITALVKTYLNEGRIPKFHGIGAIALDRFLKSRGIEDFGILGVVRNPYDRAVSLAFHNRYHKNNHTFKQKKFDTDEEAVIWTATEDTGFRKSHTRQVADLMLPFFSTYSNHYDFGDFNYVWTTYEWLKEDTVGEVQTALRTLFHGQTIPRTQFIEKFVQAHGFKQKSGREVGTEKRDDLWRRKGTVGDYKNWFNDDCYKSLERHQNLYNGIVNREKLGKTGEIPYI